MILTPQTNPTAVSARKEVGEPYINIQKDGKMAKPYQVRQAIKALEMWREYHEHS